MKTVFVLVPLVAWVGVCSLAAFVIGPLAFYLMVGAAIPFLMLMYLVESLCLPIFRRLEEAEVHGVALVVAVLLAGALPGAALGLLGAEFLSGGRRPEHLATACCYGAVLGSPGRRPFVAARRASFGEAGRSGVDDAS